MVNGKCRPRNDTNGGGSGPAIKTRTVTCGRAYAHRDRPGWNAALCGAKPIICSEPGLFNGGAPLLTPAFATQQQDPRTGAWQTTQLWCPAKARPIPNTQALIDTVVKLLPPVSIGEPPGKHETLVNLQTILWAATTPNRNLGRVQVIGQPVWLRLHFDHAAWNFGDGHADTTTNPGKPYDAAANPCLAKECPDYYGHTYTSNVSVKLALTVAWRADYSLNGANWAPIDTPPLDGPQTTAQLHVLQARGVLVPNPEGG